MAEKTNTIRVTHITIRQSISFLLMRLILLDIFAAIFVILFFYIIYSNYVSESVRMIVISYSSIYFSLLAILKVGLVIFVVLRWLNEYYEVYPTLVMYRSGFIWRKEEHNSFDEIVHVGIHQGLLGRIFNYGTISLYDYRQRKVLSLYLIHNPHKYFRILQSLLPDRDIEKEVIRERIVEPDEN